MTTPDTHIFMPAAERPWRPWKNGTGEMADICLSPADSDWNTFKWRVGIAKIEQDCPFSHFADVDRTFMIVGGRGVRLDIGGDIHRVDHKSPPLMFPGDVATSAKLIDGPTLALNVMARRGWVQTRVGLIDEPSEFVPGSEARAVLVWARGQATVNIHGAPVKVGMHDAILFEPGVNVKIEPGERGHGWLIEVRTTKAGPVTAPAATA